MLSMTDTGALLRFVQRPNAVDLDEGSTALQQAGRYSELVALLQSRGMHEQALDLLQALSQAADTMPIAPRGICPHVLLKTNDQNVSAAFHAYSS